MCPSPAPHGPLPRLVSRERRTDVSGHVLGSSQPLAWVTHGIPLPLRRGPTGFGVSTRLSDRD